MSDFPQKAPVLWIQTGELSKKTKKIWKKVLTNGNVFGILTERSRERVENRLDDSAKQKHFVN